MFVFRYFLDKTPLGPIQITATEIGISAIHFEAPSTAYENDSSPILNDCIQQLKEYFAGHRKEFKLPLDLKGTDFQMQVWEQLLHIPFGRSISYIRLAQNLGDTKKVRAVGNANGQNPIPIIVPCHRVIGADGKLVGYSGGLDKKEWLLIHEGIRQKELSLF